MLEQTDFFSALAAKMKPFSGEIALCPVCGEPVEKLLPKGNVVVPVNCACGRAAFAKMKQETEDAQFRMMIRELWEEDGICSTGFQSETFEKWDGTNEKIMELAKRYAENFGSMKAMKCGILLFGDVGTGKSFTAHCIANEVLKKQINVCVSSMPQLIQRSMDRVNVPAKMLHYPLMVIDDVGMERQSDFGAETVYNIIDSRYTSGLPLIVTTNLDLDAFASGKNRAYDRLLQMCPIHLRFTGGSKRGGIAEQITEEARRVLMSC